MTIHRPTTSAAAGAVACAVAALLYGFDPAASALYPSCPLRAFTGLLCPLCGSLRAAHALVHGHVANAFLLNPLTTTGGAVAAILAVTGRGSELAAPQTLRIGLIVAIAFGLVRNLPAVR